MKAKPKLPKLPLKFRVLSALLHARARLSEPSTYGALAVIAGGIAQAVGADAEQVAAVASVVAAPGVFLRERGAR